jgi:hypothetical protein
MTGTDSTRGVIEQWHDFHAEANLLSGELKRPIEQQIIPQAALKLTGRKGGYFFQRVEGYSLEGLITFKSGYTRVAGYRSLKNKAWVTLATSVLEGLNVLDIITADRIVAQVSTEHAVVNGHVPKVTFLGTQFENLKVSGYDLEPVINYSLCGPKPDDDVPYLHESTFLNRVREQCGAISENSIVSEDLRREFGRDLEEISELSRFRGSRNGEVKDRKLTCSLVSGYKKVPEIPGATFVKNLMHLEEFGTVSFAHLEVGRRLETSRKGDPMDENGSDMSNYFTLKMLEMRLGCVAHGTASGGGAGTNGKTKP